LISFDLIIEYGFIIVQQVGFVIIRLVIRLEK